MFHHGHSKPQTENGDATLERSERSADLGRQQQGVIVVGLDASLRDGESSHALHAAAYAAGLAHRQGARLVAVWVRPEVAIADTFSETVATIAHEREDIESELRETVEEAADHFGIPATSVLVREGDPFEELTAVAEELHADAIVVGASEQRLGSLAVQLVRHARWPVTVVP